MERTFHKRIEKSPSANIRALLTFLLLAVASLAGCDDEHDRAWREWRGEAGKVDYRCGMFGKYETEVNKAYLRFGPSYEGRSDWEPNGPPPLSCSAKLSAIYIDAYWPNLKPAGSLPAKFTIGGEKDPNYISIGITATPNRRTGDLLLFLRSALELKDSEFVNPENHLIIPDGLFTDGQIHRKSRLTNHTFFWKTNERGTVSIFIECQLSENKLINDCVQNKYLPKLNSVISVTYEREHLKSWKVIGEKIEKFINKNLTIKES